MKFKLSKAISLVLLMGASSLVSAAIIPSGIQANLSQATIESWGFNECSRTGASETASTASVISNCSTGTHLMMAAWDASLGMYGIAAVGDFDTVTRVTFTNYNDDSNYNVLDNWSNGVNFYRTAGYGSWGFTDSISVALNSADINLINGLSNYSSAGTTTSELSTGVAARGLSWHVNANGGGDLSSGWTYNATGYNNQSLYQIGDQRVFFTATVSEPSVLAILALGLFGLGARRFKK